MIQNLSLAGVKEYAESKGGVANSTHPSRHLRDLEDLVNEMCQVRSGLLNSSTCGCHGYQLEGRSKTVCNSHTRTSYGKSTISLAELVEIIDMLPSCSCNAHPDIGCRCVSVCSCDCNVCYCNCDFCSCNCDFCSCNCDFMPPVYN